MIKKKYFEGAFTRFLSWPKTKLVGNHFHYYDENEKVEGFSPVYYQEKLPRSNNWFVKIVAAILYPFFNPIAFIFRKIGTLFSEYKDVQESIKMHDDGLAASMTLAKLANSQVEAMNAEAILKSLQDSEGKINKRWPELVEEAVQESDGNLFTSKNKQVVDKLFSSAYSNFLLIITALEKLAKEEHITTQEAFAKRLVKQNTFGESEEKVIVCYSFIYSALISLYNNVRQNKTFCYLPGVMVNGEPVIAHDYKDKANTRFHENAEQFYTKGTLEYKWRKMYNACIKSFYAHSLFNREAISKADGRFDHWTRIDSSKQENFVPCPDTRPT